MGRDMETDERVQKADPSAPRHAHKSKQTPPSFPSSFPPSLPPSLPSSYHPNVQRRGKTQLHARAGDRDNPPSLPPSLPPSHPTDKLPEV